MWGEVGPGKKEDPSWCALWRGSPQRHDSRGASRWVLHCVRPIRVLWDCLFGRQGCVPCPTRDSCLCGGDREYVNDGVLVLVHPGRAFLWSGVGSAMLASQSPIWSSSWTCLPVRPKREPRTGRSGTNAQIFKSVSRMCFRNCSSRKRNVVAPGRYDLTLVQPPIPSTTPWNG